MLTDHRVLLEKKRYMKGRIGIVKKYLTRIHDHIDGSNLMSKLIILNPSASRRISKHFFVSLR